MLVIGFAAEAFATNCYVLAPAPGEECIVVDPGFGVVPHLNEVLAEHKLRPAAVLLTHGHVDHVYSVTPVCSSAGVPALIHPDDSYRLGNPFKTLDAQLLRMLEQQFGPAMTWTEPDDVRSIVDGETLNIAGLALRIDHAPGHREGSVLFGLSTPEAPLCLSGDVLFAGSIGRTDTAGGDSAAMKRSLRNKVLTMADDVVVLPGHGPTTTIGAERARNPYLQSSFLGGGHTGG